MTTTTSPTDEHLRHARKNALRTLCSILLLALGWIDAGTADARLNLGNLGIGGLGGPVVNPGLIGDPFPVPVPTPPQVEPLPLPPPGSLSFQGIGPDHLRYIVYLREAGTFDLFRDGPDGTILVERWNPTGPTSFDYVDSGLADGQSYCHRLVHVATGKAHKQCQRLPFTRVVFEEPTITAAESDDVLNRFDWRRTDRLSATAIPPPLYYGNVLVDHPDMAEALRRAGVHVQTEPLFPDEAAAWSGDDIAIRDGVVLGRWHYVVVPADIYNEIRDASIDALEAGEEPDVSVLALRHIHERSGRAQADRPYQLSYDHLGRLGFEFNADPAAGQCQSGIDGVGCQTQELLGWVLRKVGNYFAELADEVVDAVREGFGRVQKLVFGKRMQRFSIRILNTDEAFGVDEEMMSGWAGRPLRLANHRIQVRQGFGAVTARTDENGNGTASLAEKVPFQVCFDLENRFLEVTSLFVERTVCSPRFALTDQNVEVRVRHDHANVFLQITDAGTYLEDVVGHSMGKITVQVGRLSNTLTEFNDHRAFAPCGSKFPSVVSSLAELIPIVNLAGVPADFMTAVDVVMPDDATRSRGVGVHEYGHTVLCDMIRRQSGHTGLATAWAEATIQSTTQRPSDEAAYINEAFADFFTMQVVGGTNYFGTTPARRSRNVNYCDASSATAGGCLEENFADQSTFPGQVSRIASILHDAFDGRADCDRRSEPNDGAQWSTRVQPFRVRAAGTNGPACPTTGTDDAVELAGSKLPAVLDRWADLAGVIDTLGESEFLGGLARVMLESGHTAGDICDLFALHGTACPIDGATQTSGSWRDQLVLLPGLGTTPFALSHAPIAELLEEPDTDTSTVGLEGTERIDIPGRAPVSLKSALGVRLGDGSFEGVDVLGGRLTGTWESTGRGRNVRVTLDPGADVALRDLIGVGAYDEIGAEAAAVEILGTPRCRLVVRADGRTTLRISAKFQVEIDGRLRRGRYRANFSGDVL